LAKTDSIDRLTAYRTLWQSKPVLRQLYEKDYQAIASRMNAGRTLEVGGGSGNLKAYRADIISIDIQQTPWLDVVADAHRLPFADGSFDNIVMFDVLHHLESPHIFFQETSRILRPGGRLIAMEPAITPISYVFYKIFHPEPVHIGVDPLAEDRLSADRSPWDSNQAIPTLLFRKSPHLLEDAFPQLRIAEVSFRALFAYPLSGGFRRWALLPQGLVQPLVRLEERLMPFLGPFMAFRLLAVVHRN
jgi:SAM-dependent methyltransferase